jgi:hypothetical protein
MPNSKSSHRGSQSDTAREIEREAGVAMDATKPNPGTGEQGIMSDSEATNSRVSGVELDGNGDPVEPRTANQLNATRMQERPSGTVRMTKDGAELDVSTHDVEAHRRMGWGFVR